MATSTASPLEPRVVPKRHLTRVRALLTLERGAQHALQLAEDGWREAEREDRTARREFAATLFEARAAIARAQASLTRLGLRVTSHPMRAEAVSAR